MIVTTKMVNLRSPENSAKFVFICREVDQRKGLAVPMFHLL